MALATKTDYFGLATDGGGLVLTSSTENSSSTATVMAKSFFMACSPLLRPYFFGSAEFLQHQKK